MKYIRKMIWFIAFRLLIACCVLGVLICAFYYAMNATNINVVLKDGMAKRARLIMTGENSAELTDYFYSTYLNRDPDIKNAQEGINYYRYFYNITDFDHRIELKWVWCWPWEDTATATVVETIPAIDGKLKSGYKEEALSLGLTSAPPTWNTVEYEAVLRRENDRWRIRNMTVMKITEDE